jgi:hypothetical protein
MPLFGSDPDLHATRDQDNFNNFSNWVTSRELGDDASARHWRDNYWGEIGHDDRDPGRHKGEEE